MPKVAKKLPSTIGKGLKEGGGGGGSVVADRVGKKLLQMPKVAKKLPSTIGKGLKEGGGGGGGQSSPTEYKGGMWKN